MDGRTRESHAIMDGKICKWGDDDGYYEWVTDEKTGKRKLKRFERPKSAYHGAPGTDFRCRCVSIAYVPEFEDDYEAEREDRPIQGVTQGAYADPDTILRNSALETERNIRENPRSEKNERLKQKERDDRTKMLYRRADELEGAERDAYILRRNADRDNYLADVMEYKVPNGPLGEDMMKAFDGYCRPNGSEKVNEYLKNKPQKKDAAIENEVRMMKEWINKNPLPENKVLYRSFPVDKSKIDEFLRKKKVVGIGGFQSFSSSLEHSSSFVDKNEYGVILKLDCKKGDKIAPPLRVKNDKMVGYPEEQEYIALPNATFKVKKSSWKGKLCYIYCEFGD